MMSNKKVNMFDKAAEDRRIKFISENSDVAEEIMSTKSKNDNKTPSDVENELQEYGIKKILSQEKPIKRRCTYYLDSSVDDFFLRLGEIINISKSKLVNELLIEAIATNEDIKELSKSNKKVKKILKEHLGEN